ncbi:biopolymer transport protein TolR [Luteimonas cucumeris]|uniref:Tol-Pal system protein TolR n=1 Tax=Luteimonas cucumeris TaxID=985012 RepID=A0A562L565_9GAMM|nr:protein TolR [Luteimonas cucumeris]TWI02763.1 biopolymer transport protein TolR [Luteimonas cucumeris]
MTTNRRHRKRKLKADINVVPYIDVMLVLLIIFMVTAPLLNLGVDIQLPQSNAKTVTEQKDPIVVSVDHEGHLFLTIEGSKNEAVTSEQLVAKVGAYVRNNPKVAVFVAGDGNAPYQTIYSVLTDLQTKANVPRAGLMSNPAEVPAK